MKKTALYWFRNQQKAEVEYAFIDGHLRKLGVLNEQALRKFWLRPQAIDVHVFRSKERLYYLEDTTHLGWTEFALGTIKTYDFPGNHFQMFAPPDDAECARILQAALDKCA